MGQGQSIFQSGNDPHRPMAVVKLSILSAPAQGSLSQCAPSQGAHPFRKPALHSGPRNSVHSVPREPHNFSVLLEISNQPPYSMWNQSFSFSSATSALWKTLLSLLYTIERAAYRNLNGTVS